MCHVCNGDNRFYREVQDHYDAAGFGSGAEYVVMHTVYQTVRAWTRDEAEGIARHALLDNPGLYYPELAGDGYAVLEGS